MRSHEPVEFRDQRRQPGERLLAVAVGCAWACALAFVVAPLDGAAAGDAFDGGQQRVLGAVQSVVPQHGLAQEHGSLGGAARIVGLGADALPQRREPEPYLYVCLGLLACQVLILAAHGFVLGMQVHRTRRLFEAQHCAETLANHYRSAAYALQLEQYRMPAEIAKALADGAHQEGR